MAVGGVEADLGGRWWRWGAVYETVVGAAPERWTTAGMKREARMQGSRSEGMHERGRSLVMDDGVRVLAPAWWRSTAMDGVADGGGCGGEGVLAPTEYELGNGGREEGGTMSSGRACLKCEEIYKLSPRLKFPT